MRGFFYRNTEQITIAAKAMTIIVVTIRILLLLIDQSGLSPLLMGSSSVCTTLCGKKTLVAG